MTRDVTENASSLGRQEIIEKALLKNISGGDFGYCPVSIDICKVAICARNVCGHVPSGGSALWADTCTADVCTADICRT